MTINQAMQYVMRNRTRAGRIDAVMELVGDGRISPAQANLMMASAEIDSAPPPVDLANLKKAPKAWIDSIQREVDAKVDEIQRNLAAAAWNPTGMVNAIVTYSPNTITISSNDASVPEANRLHAVTKETAMATTTPPCSGVLRGRSVADEFICRCGFTVDHESIISCQGDVAKLLAAGRMTPAPSGTPGIRVADSFGEVTREMWDARCEKLPEFSLDAAAREQAGELGLVYQGQERGRYLCVRRPPADGCVDAAVQLERKAVYGI